MTGTIIIFCSVIGPNQKNKKKQPEGWDTFFQLSQSSVFCFFCRQWQNEKVIKGPRESQTVVSYPGGCVWSQLSRGTGQRHGNPPARPVRADAVWAVRRSLSIHFRVDARLSPIERRSLSILYIEKRASLFLNWKGESLYSFYREE